MKRLLTEAKQIGLLVGILVAVPYVIGYSAAKGAMKAGFQPVTINTVNVEDRRPWPQTAN